MAREISFVEGVRAEPINEYFRHIQRQIEAERKELTGKGISSGLEVLSDEQEPRDITISKGRIIDSAGKEILVENKSIMLEEIEPKKSNKDSTFVIREGGIINLPEKPYSNFYKRYHSHHQEDIIITNRANQEVIPFIEVDEKTVRVIGSAVGRTVTVEYFIAEPRIDVLYFNKKTQEIEIAKGNHSSSPSIPIDEEDYLIIAYAKLIPSENRTEVEIIKDDRDLRNIFVDENKKLILSGLDFIETIKNLRAGIIYIGHDAPEEDKYNLYYNTKDNRLYAFVNEQWIAVNEEKYRPVKIIYTFDEETVEKEILDAEEQDWEFYFKPEDYFEPGLNALSVIIDNIPLTQDQFKEITTITDELGYEQVKGFRLTTPLDKPVYVEAQIFRYTREPEKNSYFQRSATFIGEEEVIVTQQVLDEGYELNHITYIPGENQLSLFNQEGRVLIKSIDYEEEETHKRTNKIYLKDTNNINDTVYIKAFTHFYSYDHMNDFINKVVEKAESAKENTLEFQEKIEELEDKFTDDIFAINNNLTNVDITTSNLTQKIEELEEKIEILAQKSYQKPILYKSMSDGNIVSFPFNIKQEDYIKVFYQMGRTEDNRESLIVLREGIGDDYTIEYESRSIVFDPIYINEENQYIINIVRQGINMGGNDNDMLDD